MPRLLNIFHKQILFLLMFCQLEKSSCQIATTIRDGQPVRNFPGDKNFPPESKFNELETTLDGELIYKSDGTYDDFAKNYNIWTQTMPYVIAVVESVADVQKVMRFSKTWNLMVSIRSTGHDFIGRSSYTGSIQINFMRMKDMQVDLSSSRWSDGEIKVETGCQWLEVYEKVDEVDRVIVGGSAHTVGMGGYTMGGGHSPIGRNFGLSVDNLLEATIVLASGQVAVVSDEGIDLYEDELGGEFEHEDDNSLFWAIKGGGGTAWGAVVSFVFKIHAAPPQAVNVLATWVLRVPNYDTFGRETMKTVLREINKMCPSWGGYFITSNPQFTDPIPASGILSVFLNYIGPEDSPCADDADVLSALNIDQSQVVLNKTVYSTFLEYERTAIDPAETNSYLVNSFIQPWAVEDEKLLDGLVDTLMGIAPYTSCTGTFVGGNMKNFAGYSTPVNPAFRTGLLALTCGSGWLPSETYLAESRKKEAQKLGENLRQFGEGTYYNECGDYMDDWKTLYWADKETYCRLLEIKLKYDPDIFLWCHQCVASDGLLTCGDYYESGASSVRLSFIKILMGTALCLIASML